MYLEIINRLLEKFKSLGERKTLSGATLIGKAEFIAPNAWLHKIYKPLTEEEITNLENSLSTDIPLVYKQFLQETNGCKLFNTTLTLDGYRANYIRDEESVWQPFDLTSINVDERIEGADQNLFFIGGYDWDGSLIYLNKKTNRISRCSNDSVEPLNSWPDFETFLEKEINRLEKLFDSSGQELDEDISTAPPDS